MLFHHSGRSIAGRHHIHIMGAAALSMGALLAGAGQDGGDAAPPPLTDADQQEAGAPPALPEALRNPRALREEQGKAQGPRMVAGAISITSPPPMECYTRLEPIIGDFTFTGRQMMRQDSAPIEFEGEWTNRWVLDGLYLQSAFTLNDRSGAPYEVLGLMWYDENEHQYEAHYFSSANSTQTQRWGNFSDDATTSGATGEAPSGDDAASAPASTGESADDLAEFPTLTMLARSTNQPEDSEPTSRFELAIVSVNEFRYAGYNRGRDGTGDWRKTFEMTMTRKEPIELGAAESD